MRQYAKMLLGACLSLVGAGVVACLLSLLSSILPQNLAFIPMIPYVFLLMGIVFGAALISLYIFLHYYRSFFTDTGYLTFVFPATPKEQLDAKILSGITFTVAIAISAILGFLIAVFPVAGFDIFYIFMPLSGSTGFNILYDLILIFSILFSLVSQVFMLYLVITLGSIFFSKHKIIGSVLFYVIVNSVVSFAEGVIMVIIFAIMFSAPEIVAGILTTLVTLLFSIGTLIASYIINLRVLQRRLNLE